MVQRRRARAGAIGVSTESASDVFPRSLVLIVNSRIFMAEIPGLGIRATAQIFQINLRYDDLGFAGRNAVGRAC
jgi:hypothetical protein